jgi:hypothetical protein
MDVLEHFPTAAEGFQEITTCVEVLDEVFGLEFEIDFLLLAGWMCRCAKATPRAQNSRIRHLAQPPQLGAASFALWITPISTIDSFYVKRPLTVPAHGVS